MGWRWRYLQCTGTFSVVLVALGIVCGELLLQSSLNIVQEESTINSNQSIWRPTVAPELRARCFVSLAQKLFATKACTIINGETTQQGAPRSFCGTTVYSFLSS